jgi:hypothetical protein
MEQPSSRSRRSSERRRLPVRPLQYLHPGLQHLHAILMPLEHETRDRSRFRAGIRQAFAAAAEARRMQYAEA